MRTYGSWVKFVGLSSLIVVALVMIAPSIAAQFGDLLIRRLTLDEDGALGGGDEITIQAGILTPEGNVVGSPGDIYIEHDGTAGNVFHLKDGGTGDDDNGWILLGTTPVALVANTLTLDVANADARISRIRNGAFLFAEIGGAAENFEIDLGFLADVVKFESFSGAAANYLWTAATVANLEIRGGNGFPGIFEMGRADTVIADTEVIGIAQFVAKDETSGGDANLPGAAIWAEAKGAFDATNNPTDLHFCTSLSEDCGPDGDTRPDMTLEQDGDLALKNATEGSIAAIRYGNTRDLVTLSGATTDTTTISIPSGAKPDGCSFNVDVGVVNSGDNTWSADFITGSSTSLVTLAAAAVDTKVDLLIADEVTTGVTEIQFTPQSGTFSAGQIEVVCYYQALTSLGDV